MTSSVKKIISFTFLCLLACLLPCTAQESTHPPIVKAGSSRQQYQAAEADGEIQTTRSDAQKDKRTLRHQKRHAVSEKQLARLSLPQDTTPRLTVKQIRITGNTLISTGALLEGVPLVYNASDQPLFKAESRDLYDLRILHEIISKPGQPRVRVLEAPPAKMTSFGGMYPVGGYDEYEIVADGGILASIQYEYGLVRHTELPEPSEPAPEAVQTNAINTNNTFIRKLTPLVLVNYGWTSIVDAVAGEKEHQTLWSVGLVRLLNSEIILAEPYITVIQ